MNQSILFIVVAIFSNFQLNLSTTNESEKEKQDDWFAFQTKHEFTPGVIDASSWLDAPAGKHGVLTQKNDFFEFEDKTRIKFWGVNIADKTCFQKKNASDNYARYLAKYGVNAVRFHKFSWALTNNMPESVLPNPEKLDLLDYFSSQLKEKGIYFGWSHIYGHRIFPGDSSKLIAYNEIKEIGGGHLKGSSYNLVYFAPDLQELNIKLTENLLNHVNPYTGLRYADDPALCFVELNNEDNLFFASAHGRIMSAPTYKKLIEEMFCDWLRKKYPSHESLVQAWGEDAINAFPEAEDNEHLGNNNIYPMAHHVILSTDYIEKNPHLKKRLWDTARFLYETQNNYYERFVAAVRKTGYRGPIVPSCWQAGDNVAHLYNLHSDFLFGFIDRHNYYGGKNENNNPMLSNPGTGLLSSGLQQVENRPFALSEWMSIMPNEWITESAPLIAVYGMGLQGWDASYAYASNQPSLSSTLNAKHHGVYNADAPTHMGLYPALSRMVYRQDVKEGDVVATRYVHIPSLIDGKIGFSEKIFQLKDAKEFSGTIPKESLAIGKSVIQFTNSFMKTQTPDFSAYWNKNKKQIESVTKQLVWDYSNRGFITINTPGTVGFIGFPTTKNFKVGNFTFNCTNEFAIVLITSLEKDKNIAQSNSLLISTFARAKNTKMIFNESSYSYTEIGESPILLEPVNVSVKCNNMDSYTCFLLNHQGENTDKQLIPNDNEVFLNGSAYKTCYYLLER